MRSRRMVLSSAALLTVACGLAATAWLSSATAALMVEGPLYTWNDGDVTSDWVAADNWSGPSGYPSSTAHGADFPFSVGVIWEVDLTTNETIGQLGIDNSVNFTGDSSTPTLTVKPLILDATDGAITVTFHDKMVFTANAP